MEDTQRRTAVFALLGLLVLGAGCQSMIPGGSGGPADAASTNGSVDLDAHESKLRDAGSVTVRSSSTRTIRKNGAVLTRNQSRYSKLNFDSGRVFTRLEPLRGDVEEAYHPGNGTGKTYEVPSPAKDPVFVDPTRSSGINRSRLVRILTVEESALERRDSKTVDGVSGTVYVADSFEAVEPGAYDSVSASDVTDFQATYVVGEEGFVKYVHYNLTVSRGGVTATDSTTMRFSDIGSTTVSPPDWLERAKAAAARPDPDDTITRNVTASGPDGNVTLTVTGRAGDLREGVGIGPTISENPTYRNDFLNRIRVGEIARYYYPAESTKSVTITVPYDDSAVADANESRLGLVVSNRTRGAFERLDSTVHPDENVVTVTIRDDARLHHFQGKTILAIDWPRYLDRLSK